MKLLPEQSVKLNVGLRSDTKKKTLNMRKSCGKPPKAPEPGVKDHDQVNLTDEESRIMPVSGGGFMQAYNAQASVDLDTMLMVAV